MRYLVGDLEREFYDFPSNYWECLIIPTDFHSIIFQRGWWLNHQPGIPNCHNCHNLEMQKNRYAYYLRKL